VPINPHSASTSFYKNGMQACGTLGPREVAHMHAHLREQGDLTHVWPPCGRVLAVPGGRQNMLIHVKVGVPPEFPQVDVEELSKIFPYGKLLPIEVVVGGLSFGCGRVVPELGDVDDTAIVAVASVSLGYHDKNDEAQQPRAWDTRDGH